MIAVFKADLVCVFTASQCTTLKLETADGTHTCRPQMAVKGVN